MQQDEYCNKASLTSNGAGAENDEIEGKTAQNTASPSILPHLTAVNYGLGRELINLTTGCFNEIQ